MLLFDYSFWRAGIRMNKQKVIDIIKMIVEAAAPFVKKWKKQLAIAGALLSFILLILFIKAQMVDNSAWLQGQWDNQQVSYSLKARKNFQNWDIKKDKRLLLEHAFIAVKSKRNQIILTDSGNNVEIHMRKRGQDQMSLTVIEKGKTVDSAELTRKPAK